MNPSITKTCTRVLAVAIAIGLTVSITGRARGGDVTALAIRPGESVLLLDDHTLARTSGLSQQFFPAKRHAANPVITKTQTWEGVGPYVWGTRLLQDEATGELRLWYITYDYAGNYYRWGLATSRDGLSWTKPELNVSTFD